ncbi:MAG: YbaB/EbfC family nucleoid-associated protein [Pseudomonadota bacterium]
MKDFGEFMKQAAGLQAKMQDLQEKIAAMEVDGQAGGGMVTVTLTGKGYAKSVKIDPALLSADEGEVLEDLLTAAINDAKARLETQSTEEMKALTAGMPLPPGFKLPF